MMWGRPKKVVDPIVQDRLLSEASRLADQLVAASADLRLVVKELHLAASHKPREN